MVAKFLGVTWDPMKDRFKMYDIPEYRVGIKWTSGNRLYVPEDSPDDIVYILVRSTDDFFTYEICGYAHAIDVKIRGELFIDQRTGYRSKYLPLTLLMPIELMREKMLMTEVEQNG